MKSSCSGRQLNFGTSEKASVGLRGLLQGIVTKIVTSLGKAFLDFSDTHQHHSSNFLHLTKSFVANQIYKNLLMFEIENIYGS